MANSNRPTGGSNSRTQAPVVREKPFSESYPEGQRDDSRLQHLQQEVEDNGATRSLITGIVLASIIGLGAAAFYFWPKPQPTSTTIINTPARPAASAAPSVAPSPAQPTRIIERTVEKTTPGEVKIIEVEKPVVREVPTSPPAPVSPSPQTSSQPDAKSIPSPDSNVQPASPSDSESDSTKNRTDQLPR
jgi:hypothetical protein